MKTQPRVTSRNSADSETVTVVFSSNDRYSMLLGVALCSIFENKAGDYPIAIYVVDGNISAQNKERLAVLEQRYQFTINYVAPDKQLFAGIQLDDIVKRHYYLPREAYYRIGIGRFLPADCHKLVYLDVDVVVRGDIAELYHYDLGGKSLGAVIDPDPTAPKYLEILRDAMHFKELPADAMYLNSGMLLIDLDRWRELGIEKKLFQFIEEHPDKLWHHDQDALNGVFLGDCQPLPPRYNLLTEYADVQGDRDPLIVHFVGGGKPWYFFSALPFRSDYIYYINKTPWRREKYRKVMDIYFAKKYHLYPIAWWFWSMYKKIRT